MLYCMKCHKWANKNHPCSTHSLISVTENMLPVVHIIDSSLGLQVASAFCLITHNQIEAGVMFKCIYPDILFQDLPSGWYLLDYITIDNHAICSCLSYEAYYIDTGTLSLNEYVEGVINDLIRYLKTRDKDGLRSLLLLTGD